MAIAFVRQSTFTGTAAGTTLTAGTITAPTAGNALVLFYASDLGQTIVSIAQTGCTWTKLKASATQDAGEIWVALNVPAGAGTGVTITIAANVATTYAVNVAEFSGVATSAASDGAGSSGTNTKATAASTGSFTTANANDLIVAMVSQESNTAPSVQPSGYSTLTFVAATNFHAVQANYKIVSATGSQSAAWTITKGNYDASIYALKQAAGTAFTQSLTAATVAQGASLGRTFGRPVAAATIAQAATLARSPTKAISAATLALSATVRKLLSRSITAS